MRALIFLHRTKRAQCVHDVTCLPRFADHYGASISGSGADMHAPLPNQPITTTHGDMPTFTENGKGKGLGYSSQSFSEHNGNEARQTYHGTPPPPSPLKLGTLAAALLLGGTYIREYYSRIPCNDYSCRLQHFVPMQSKMTAAEALRPTLHSVQY